MTDRQTDRARFLLSEECVCVCIGRGSMVVPIRLELVCVCVCVCVLGQSLHPMLFSPLQSVSESTLSSLCCFTPLRHTDLT